jgi:DNA-binding NarL/FixJ family response regulator
VLRLPALERAVLDGWGDPVPALRANLAEHERAGEQRLAGTCRDLLRRAGAPTRRGRGAGPVPPALRAAGVTSRELDVLRLVQDGRSNAQIAERLFLSTRTVETHVAHLLAKSGTADRSRLADWSRERDEPAEDRP